MALQYSPQSHARDEIVGIKPLLAAIRAWERLLFCVAGVTFRSYCVARDRARIGTRLAAQICSDGLC